jgi:hypothetical protein
LLLVRSAPPIPGTFFGTIFIPYGFRKPKPSQANAGVRPVGGDRDVGVDGHRGAAAGQRSVHGHAVGLLQRCAGRKVLLAAVVAHREREERFAGVGELDVVAGNVPQAFAVDRAAVRRRPLLEDQPLRPIALEEHDRVVLVIRLRGKVGDQRDARPGHGVDLVQTTAGEVRTRTRAFGAAAEVVHVQHSVVPGHAVDVRAEVPEFRMWSGVESGDARAPR